MIFLSSNCNHLLPGVSIIHSKSICKLFSKVLHFFPTQRIYHQPSALQSDSAVDLNVGWSSLLWACCSSCHSFCSLLWGAGADGSKKGQIDLIPGSLIAPEPRNCLFWCRTGLSIPALTYCFESSLSHWEKERFYLTAMKFGIPLASVCPAAN